MNISTGASGIPAGACWHLAHGRLYSGPPIVEAAPDESWDDADRFFGRLGQEFGPRAVAAVLSGTGEVGPGLQAVRAAGGRVLVQAPETAQYVQLPLSALESGAADTVLGAGELAIYLSAVLPGSSELTREQFALLDMPQPPEPLRGRLQAITDEVERQTGCDFGHYRWTSVLRHIERRMHHLPLGGRGATLEDYLAWLQRTPEEGAQLRHRMVANTTCFFRDSSAWAALGRELRQNLAQELAEHAAGGDEKSAEPWEWRAWVVGCSGGQEAYTAAMLMQELAAEVGAAEQVRPRVFATDIDPELLTEARRGWYTPETVSALSPERLARFFVTDAGGYRVQQSVRDCVSFVQHDTFGGPPITRLSLVTCRNLLVYLSPLLQRRMLDTFAGALLPGGLLLLSPAEQVSLSPDSEGPLTNVRCGAAPDPEPQPGELPFEVLERRWQIYRRTDASAPLRPPRRQPNMAQLQAMLQATLQRSWTPPAAVLDARGHLLERTANLSAYLAPDAQDLSGFPPQWQPLLRDLLSGAQVSGRAGGGWAEATPDQPRLWLNVEPLPEVADSWLLVLAPTPPLAN